MTQSTVSKKNVTIPNWTHFGVGHAIIELIEYNNPKNHEETIYNGFVTCFLLDGNDESDRGSEKVISLNTVIFDEDPYEASLECAHLALQLFGQISRIVYIFNDSGEMIGELELDKQDFPDLINDDEDYDGSEPKDDEVTYNDFPISMRIPKNRVLH